MESKSPAGILDIETLKKGDLVKKTYELSDAEFEVILYCIHYTVERDDEGVRSSDPVAIQRTKLIDQVLNALSH